MLNFPDFAPRILQSRWLAWGSPLGQADDISA